MIRPAVRLGLLSVLLWLQQGCAFIHSLDGDLEQKIEAWVARHEYQQALSTLEYIKPSHRNYEALQTRKQQIRAAALQYEQTQIREATAHIDRQQWYEAGTLLSTARQKLPGSEALAIAWQNFLRLRDEHLQRIYAQLTLHQAEQLVKDKPLRAELQRILPQDRAQQKAHAQYEQEVERVRHALLDCGLTAMHNKELSQAERCFVLANALAPHAELQLTIQEIQQQLEQPAAKKIMVLSDKGHAELALARESLNGGNLLQAKQHYQNIPDKDKRHNLVKTFAQELDARIESNVKQGIEVGRKLYTQGEIERALAVWNKLRQIDPHNEYLLSHIERAERVMKKLNELRQLNQPQSTDKPTR